MSSYKKNRPRRRLSVDYANEPKKEPFLFCLNGKRPHWEKMPNRKLYLNKNDPEVIDNKIKTNRYTALNFFPKNLLDQMKKAPYFFFLIISLLQIPTEISNTNGRPLALLPLSCLLAISMTKDLVEDLRAYRSDKIENESEVEVLQNGAFIKQEWQSLLIGDIVRIKEGQFFPADLILLSTSTNTRTCFIETKNLDGESNLKHKECCSELGDRYSTVAKITSSSDYFEYEKPNPYLYKFQGSVTMVDNGTSSTKALDNKSFLLRGCSLRNTEWIIGLVAYSG